MLSFASMFYLFILFIIINMQYCSSFKCLTVIQYFYTLLNDYDSKTTCHLSPYKVVMTLLTVFPMCTLYPRDLFIL